MHAVQGGLAMGGVHFRMSPANKRGTVAGTTRGGLTLWGACVVDIWMARHWGTGPGGRDRWHARQGGLTQGLCGAEAGLTGRSRQCALK